MQDSEGWHAAQRCAARRSSSGWYGWANDASPGRMAPPSRQTRRHRRTLARMRTRRRHGPLQQQPECKRPPLSSCICAAAKRCAEGRAVQMMRSGSSRRPTEQAVCKRRLGRVHSHLASFLLAVSRKSLISLICFGCRGTSGKAQRARQSEAGWDAAELATARTRPSARRCQGASQGLGAALPWSRVPRSQVNRLTVAVVLKGHKAGFLFLG